MSNATAENAPETLEKVIAKVKDSAEIDLKNGEFYGATTLLKYAKSVKGKEGEKAQLQDWLDREPTRVAMGILFGSIEAIVDPKVSPTFSSLYAKLKKEYKNKDGDFANALIAHVDTPKQIKDFIIASLTSTKKYIADKKNVYTLDNIHNPNSELGKLMKPALMEGILKGVTAITAPEKKPQRGLLERIYKRARKADAIDTEGRKERAKVAETAKAIVSFAEKIGKDFDVPNDALKLALSGGLGDTCPGKINKLFMETFKDDKHPSPKPDKYHYIDLYKLNDPELRERFGNKATEILGNIAKAANAAILDNGSISQSTLTRMDSATSNVNSLSTTSTDSAFSDNSPSQKRGAWVKDISDNELYKALCEEAAEKIITKAAAIYSNPADQISIAESNNQITKLTNYFIKAKIDPKIFDHTIFQQDIIGALSNRQTISTNGVSASTVQTLANDITKLEQIRAQANAAGKQYRATTNPPPKILPKPRKSPGQSHV